MCIVKEKNYKMLYNFCNGYNKFLKHMCIKIQSKFYIVLICTYF